MFRIVMVRVDGALEVERAYSRRFAEYWARHSARTGLYSSISVEVL